MSRWKLILMLVGIALALVVALAFLLSNTLPNGPERRVYSLGGGIVIGVLCMLVYLRHDT